MLCFLTVLLGNVSSNSKEMVSFMKLRVGLCGFGSFYSSAFAAACRANSAVDLVAGTHPHQSDEEVVKLIGVTKQKWADNLKLRRYEQVRDMVEAEKLDIVFVASADNVKARHAVEAADAGSHVFLPKPMCKTLADVDAMIDAAKRNNVLISSLMPARYDGAIRSVYGQVAGGAIGDVLTVRAWIQHGCFGPGTTFEGHPEFGPEQGGIPLSLGVYAADLILWVIDSDPIRAYAEYDNLGTPHSIWMDTGKGTVRFADGRMGSMDIIFNVECGAPPWEMEVVGTKGIARAHLDMMEGIVWSSGGCRVFHRTQNDTIVVAVNSFVKSCVQGVQPEVTLNHIHRVLELSLAWKRSASENAPVSLPLS